MTNIKRKQRDANVLPDWVASSSPQWLMLIFCVGAVIIVGVEVTSVKADPFSTVTPAAIEELRINTYVSDERTTSGHITTTVPDETTSDKPDLSPNTGTVTYNTTQQVPIQDVHSTLLEQDSMDDDDIELSFWPAFVNSLSMIIATEIGDKTFFIAAVLSMRNDRLVVFAGAILALAVMTILSSFMGLALPALFPRQYTHIFGGILFLYFGVKLIYDARSIEKGKCSDELEEVEEELGNENKDEDLKNSTTSNLEEGSLDSNITGHHHTPSELAALQQQKQRKKVFLQALSLTFLAEWGDRSQIATIALAAAKNPYGVNVGGILGHSLCTGMAVIGGRILAARIEERTVTMFSGVIFLFFGVHSLLVEEA